MSDTDVPWDDRRVRRARAATLAAQGVTVATALAMPAIGLLFEPRPGWIVAGATGTLLFAGALAVALYGAVTPWLGETARRRSLASLAAATVLSVPLVAPAGADEWETWSWIGGTAAGVAPLLLPRVPAALAVAGAAAATAGIGWWAGDPVLYLLLAASLAVTIAAMSGMPVWMWGLLADAQAGRAAQARLAAAEERLRFARDVHDLLGHDLSVIALKAELAERLAPVDAGAAAREAAEVRRLAASALDGVRGAVHGYRQVDVAAQAAAIERVLAASGVRCTVRGTAAGAPAEFAAVLREASTNVLRHSRARWCTIEFVRDGGGVRMRVANDGAGEAVPDRRSSGLRGLADRLAESGGTLRTWREDGVFTLEATMPETGREAGRETGSEAGASPETGAAG
ncbi:sensor histidine kinase [Actinomadura hibisca]|uniref:sensor histidine kinase n=1 Tax=Actinomadura hibisca TaxID=68565 RepID=UPI000A05F4A4|nr:histidine kinase [Actinomadura hibisca]